MMVYLAIIVVLFWLIFLVALLLYEPQENNHELKKSPFVSILIALRNEERHVEALCESLNQLAYKRSNYEILFGNDDSEDDTLFLLEKHKPDNSRVFTFNKNETGAYGKQRILTVLAKEARGAYFIFTDADMLFQPDWIEEMLSRITGNDEVVVGLTKVEGHGWWANLQNIDWLFNEWVTGWFSKLGIHLTAWGNNMLISQVTYTKIGGHGGLAQTLVEDVDLLRRVVTNGGKLVVSKRSDAVASTKATGGMMNLLHQRKRWMKGLAGLNPLMLAGALIKLLFWPATFLLTLYYPAWLLAGLITVGLKFRVLKRVSKVAKSRISLIQFLVFEIYDFVFYLLTFAFYLLPVKIVWKGRKY